MALNPLRLAEPPLTRALYTEVCTEKGGQRQQSGAPATGPNRPLPHPLEAHPSRGYVKASRPRSSSESSPPRNSSVQPRAAAARDRTTRIYGELRELIVRGRLAPGTRIIESELATRLQVSRTPVRAALQRLTQEGYVVGTGSGKQIRLSVSPLTEEDARELFEIVGELEGIAARELASRPVSERDGIVEELRDVDARLLEAADQVPPDSDRLFDLFTHFHNRLVEAGAGPRLEVLHRSVKPQADRYRRLYSSTQVARIRASVEEHGAILDAVAEGQKDRAADAVRTNWGNAADRLGEAIRRSGELGSW